MAARFDESTRANEAGDFECNICFDLAQDPIVTLCGHLFCWPCLYRWLHHHSQSQECPVCKALVQEENLVPLYGRGKTTTDPRTKPVPGVEIPSRPAGQRPEAAPAPPEQNHFSSFGFGSLGGFIPTASTTMGNTSITAGFGGFGLLFPGFLNFQIHQGFPQPAMYGATHGFPYGYPRTFYRGNDQNVAQGHRPRRTHISQWQDLHLKMLIVLVVFCVILALSWNWEGYTA